MQIQRFGFPAIPMTAPQITRSLEAYIMWLLRKVMFTENHVSTISARYIHFARGIAEAIVPGRMHTVELGFSCLSSYVPRYVQCLPVNQGRFCLARMPIVTATVVMEEVLYRPSRSKCQPNSRQPGT
jgi:hypothetical protein